MRSTGDLVSADHSLFASLSRQRGFWVILVILVVGLLASMPLAYKLMRAPEAGPGVGHVGGPR